MARGGARAGAGRKPKADAPPKKRPAKKSKAFKPQSAAEPDIPKQPAKVGHPVEYDAAIFVTICERVAGGEFLSLICAEEIMPSETTFRRWKNASDELRLAYARAREDRADTWADEIIAIADDGSRDYKEVEQDGRTRLVADTDHIQRSKLRVDTRKWVMSKHAPSSYGEKVALEHSGKDGAPLVPVINVTIGGSESQSPS